MTRPTAIWNQDSILELLTRELARTAREGGDLCVMLGGIDPPQNASPEQQAQREALLGEIAKRFTTLLRTYDHVGRYGADQLLIVVPGCSLASVLPVAEKLQQSVAQSSVEAGGTGRRRKAATGWSRRKSFLRPPLMPRPGAESGSRCGLAQGCWRP
jgi:diguanylate cyclase (GGDEF)-like protein